MTPLRYALAPILDRRPAAAAELDRILQAAPDGLTSAELGAWADAPAHHRDHCLLRAAALLWAEGVGRGALETWTDAVAEVLRCDAASLTCEVCGLRAPEVERWTSPSDALAMASMTTGWARPRAMCRACRRGSVLGDMMGRAAMRG